MSESATNPEAESNRSAPDASHASIAQLISQINSDAGFATVAQAILETACAQLGAVAANLLAIERNTSPLLRVVIRQPPSAHSATAHLRLPLRCADRLLGLLDLYWESEHPLTAAERGGLDTLANLAALLIQREQAAEAATTVATKLSQFGKHKEEFVHLVSHELRTPLTSIKGFAQLLARQQKIGDLEAVGRYGRTILHEADHLTIIVSSLMELSQMEVSIVAIRTAPFDINEATEQMLAEIGSGQRIARQLAADLPPGGGDMAVLKQALTILIAHARRVANQRLSVSTAQVNGNLNITLELTAEDWPGRRSDEVQNISLSDAMDNTPPPNPALALYIVRNLIQAMGGSFRLERINEPQSGDSPLLRYVVSLALAEGDANGSGARLRPGM